MSKWTQFRRVEVVDVLRFEPPANPANPPYPFALWPCGCEPQDGYTCDQHRTPPRYSYCYRGPDRLVAIRPGEYLVRFKDGRAMTVAPEEFGEPQYEAVGAR